MESTWTQDVKMIVKFIYELEKYDPTAEIIKEAESALLGIGIMRHTECNKFVSMYHLRHENDITCPYCIKKKDYFSVVNI